MDTKLEVIKAGMNLGISAGITEFSKAIVNTYLKPKLEEFKSKMNKKQIESITNDFSEYIERSYNKNLYMNTIVFRNQQKTVDDLYIPLTVKKRKSIHIEKESSLEICINEYKDKFISDYKKILLVDGAGMGKSTLMKYLYLNSIRQNKAIPILIELRKLNKETSIIDFIKNEINGIRVHFNEEEIIELIERGDFIFFFDGYDEINDESKNSVTNNIQEFISKAGNNNFIISSRDENELSAFGDFQRFDIKRLNESEVYSLIYKYDEYGDLSNELVEKLKTEKNLEIINEFLDNPLMASLLYKAFEYKKTIPYKKHIFYRQVYDALFEEHDLSKGGAYVHDKRSKLDIDDFHKIINYIAFNTLSKGVNYQKEQLVEIIDNARTKIIGLEFKSSDLIYDLTHSVPILIKEGNQYRWVHKSFQDYFAAKYICYNAKDNYGKILGIISKPNKINKYYNVLDFCYDIDYIGFTRFIIYPLLQNLEQCINNTYVSDKYNSYDGEEIYNRKIILFKYNDIRLEIQGDDINIHYSKKRDIIALLNLLNDKKSDIVYEKKIRDVKWSYITKKIGTGNYKLDDYIDNELNRLDLFKLLNEFFEELELSNKKNINSVLLFDYSKCMKLKNKIEKDTDNNDDFDFL